jgi:hypothetical protein
MDWAVLKKILIVMLSIISAYILASIITDVLLSFIHLSNAAEAVAGLIVFGLLFFSILQGIEKLTGIGFFRF